MRFARQPLITPVLVAAACLVVLPPSALGNSCRASQAMHKTLQADYEQADAIVVAQVTGCAEAKLPQSGTCPGQRYTLAITEVVKDSSPSRDHGGIFSGRDAARCGFGYQVGASYLLFLDRERGLARGTDALRDGDDPSSVATRERLRLLREYRDGLADDLSQTWRFTDTESGCSVSHEFAGGGMRFSVGSGLLDPRITILMRKPGLDGEARVLFSVAGLPAPLQITVSGPVFDPGVLQLGVSFDETDTIVAGSASIKVGNQVWPLYRRTTRTTHATQPINSTSYMEATGGVSAREILSAMSEPTEVVIAATKMAPPLPPVTFEPPEAVGPSAVSYTTRTSRFREAARKLKACMDRAGR